MKSVPKLILAIFAAVILFVAAFWFFWSLGALPPSQPPAIRLIIQDGEAYIKSPSDDLEEQAKSGQTVQAGDRVRTNVNSHADLMAFDGTDVRLEPGTEILVKSASASSDKLSYTFKLEGGKIWTRLLRLFDIRDEARFELSDTAATVRGTAIAMSADRDGTSMFVEHGGILLIGPMGPGQMLVGGDYAGQKTGESWIVSTTSMVNWPKAADTADHIQKDINYQRQAGILALESLGVHSGLPLDHWLYAVMGASEKLHLMLAGGNRSALQARYDGRRLARVHELIERGKSGLAFHEMNILERSLIDRYENADQTYKSIILTAVRRMLIATDNVPFDSQLYKFKINLEDLHTRLLRNNATDSIYSYLIRTDARLDEAHRLDCGRLFDESLVAAKQAMARVDVEYDGVKNSIDDTGNAIISQKRDIQTRRMERLVARSLICQNPLPEPSLETATGTDALAGQASSTSSTTPLDQGNDNNQPTASSGTQAVVPSRPATSTPPVTNMPTTTAPVLGLSRIELFGTPNPANVGNTVKLYVKGTRLDGSVEDVTSRASFKLASTLGSLQGSNYIASQAGNVGIEATVVDAGKIFTARLSMQVNQPVTLERISATVGGSTTLAQGESRVITVNAHYTSGLTQTVTPSAKFSLSNVYGSMSGATYTAGRNSIGSEAIDISYTENGITKTASVTLKIVSSYTTGPIN